MSTNDREYVPRKALTASCAELDVMFDHKRFLWIEYPTDVVYIVTQFERYEGRKGLRYYTMLVAFHRALSKRGFDPRVSYGLYGAGKLLLKLRSAVRGVNNLAAKVGRQVGNLAQRIRHPFEYIRHA